MATNENESQGPNVDEVLSDLGKRADLSWRLEYAKLAASIDVALTQAHLMVNDGRVHDSTADWKELYALADRIGESVHAACHAATLMVTCADSNKNHN
jgi:electron transfer flavoprotein alpha subunit